ncbi:MFS transporter [Actinomadura oligospora]|uniref:MFS transporter n=1 Tax=Actinomadura oligospora TaxID=111804 RepID=UPI0004AE75AF|nr:MFS transporter [Actinomadura oligospora]
MTVVAAQFAVCLGAFAVMAHLVAHLRNDLGLAASAVGLVLGTQVGLQCALLLPVGALTDLIGARRTGVIACVVRASGLGLLVVADDVGTLVLAAVVQAVGGALYNPAAQSLLAGVDSARRSRGFAAFVAAQHIATIAGPLAGLALLSLGRFSLVAGTAAVLWAVAGVLFLLLPEGVTAPVARGFRDIGASARTVLGNRAFLLFALTAVPTTLLANHIMTAVPLLGFASGAATVSFCLLAAVAAAVQPFVANGHRGERPWVLRVGLSCAAAAFFVLAPLDGTQTGALMLAAVLNGIANGLIQPTVFQRTALYAGPGRFGSYYGVLQSAAGVFAFAADLVVGRLFDLGPTGATVALTAVGASALAALLGTRVRDRPGTPRPLRGAQRIASAM